MDKEIPKDIRRKKTVRRWLIAGAGAAAIVIVALALVRWGERTVRLADISMAEAGRGDIDATISGSGTVAPAFEEVIVSPIDSKILEVYHHVGETVEAGTPLVRLDLGDAQTQVDRERDELDMMRLSLRQLEAKQQSQLSETEMNVKVAEMNLRRQEVQLVNERYLDSIGSGTADRVREVEMSLRTSRLELVQLRDRLVNERKVADAERESKQLEISIKEQSLARTAGMLADAEIRAPRRATVTAVADRLGTTMGRGQQVAVIADLGHYRIDATFPESYAGNLKSGAKAVMTVGHRKIEGTVGSVSPTSANGQLEAKIVLDNDSAGNLRQGMRADVRISTGTRADVLRIPLVQSYTGPGSYQLYVRPAGADHLEQRTVQLGVAGYDFVEVISGIQPGESVVTSPTNRFDNAKRVRIMN